MRKRVKAAIGESKHPKATKKSGVKPSRAKASTTRARTTRRSPRRLGLTAELRTRTRLRKRADGPLLQSFVAAVGVQPPADLGDQRRER